MDIAVRRVSIRYTFRNTNSWVLSSMLIC